MEPIEKHPEPENRFQNTVGKHPCQKGKKGKQASAKSSSRLFSSLANDLNPVSQIFLDIS
jgi:hypothetical protein